MADQMGGSLQPPRPPCTQESWFAPGPRSRWCRGLDSSRSLAKRAVPPDRRSEHEVLRSWSRPPEKTKCGLFQGKAAGRSQTRQESEPVWSLPAQLRGSPEPLPIKAPAACRYLYIDGGVLGGRAGESDGCAVLEDRPCVAYRGQASGGRPARDDYRLRSAGAFHGASTLAGRAGARSGDSAQFQKEPEQFSNVDIFRVSTTPPSVFPG
jgi:hypothetical protein